MYLQYIETLLIFFIYIYNNLSHLKIEIHTQIIIEDWIKTTNVFTYTYTAVPLIS